MNREAPHGRNPSFSKEGLSSGGSSRLGRNRKWWGFHVWLVGWFAVPMDSLWAQAKAATTSPRNAPWEKPEAHLKPQAKLRALVLRSTWATRRRIGEIRFRGKGNRTPKTRCFVCFYSYFSVFLGYELVMCWSLVLFASDAVRLLVSSPTNQCTCPLGHPQRHATPEGAKGSLSQQYAASHHKENYPIKALGWF